MGTYTLDNKFKYTESKRFIHLAESVPSAVLVKPIFVRPKEHSDNTEAPMLIKNHFLPAEYGIADMSTRSLRTWLLRTQHHYFVEDGLCGML